MIKTYILTLLVVLLAAVQMTHAQESMDDVFAQLDGTNDADAQSMAAGNDMAPAAVETAEGAEVQQAPAVSDSETLGLLFEKGLAQYKAGKYDEAIMAFDAMLAIDKYDSRAVAYRKRASKRVSSKEVKKQGGSRALAIADVNAAWNPEPKVLTSVDVSGDSAESSPDQQAIEQMVAHLKSITIPNLDFTDTRIEDVVFYLTENSRRFDSTGKGVNILLVGMESALGDRSVTTVITEISLFNALQVVAEVASLKFEVKANAVAIMPANYVPLSEMVMKSYDIIPEVGTDLESTDDSGGGADDLFGDAPSSASATGPVDVVDFFSIIDFPEGSSAIYQPRFHKLFVKNTPRNLKALEEILADLDEKAIMHRSQQVEIEAKFVEFNEGALEELGFDWNMYGSGTVASMGLDERGVTAGAAANSTTLDPITGQPIYADNNGRPGQNVFGSSQRFNGAQGGGGDFNGDGIDDVDNYAFEAVQGGLLSLMGGAPATMLLNNGDIDLHISAMEQEGTADVLSAPRVTTKSGSEAIIRVAETHRYPQDYDVETGQRTAPVVKPQDWEDFDLGVSLKVTPVVDTESNTIDLELQPEIMEFRGYDSYLVGFNAYKEALGDGEDSTLFAEMAYFERRFVQTQVSIADGHTVVMGGLVDERTETFRDQVPFLGDIPYLGRLFRTEGSRSVKKNLTIFVKATQVGPGGMTSAERELARQ